MKQREMKGKTPPRIRLICGDSYSKRTSSVAGICSEDLMTGISDDCSGNPLSCWQINMDPKYWNRYLVDRRTKDKDNW